MGRLRGRALDQILPYIKENGNRWALNDVEDVIKILQRTFGDPDERATARFKLQNLRQNNREFSDYYAEFSRLVAELGWDEAATMDALRNGLSLELHEKLVGAPPTTTMHEFVEQCQKLDSQLRALENLRKLRTNRGQVKTTTTATPTTSRPTPATQATTASSSKQTPAQGPRQKLSAQERATRLSEGRCLYCGGLGHMAASCPAKTNVKVASVELLDTEEEVSGKE
jgi:hypothetical protein